MDRGNIFSGSSFRATLYGAIVFLVIMAVAGILAHRFIDNHLMDDLRSQIDADMTHYQELFQEAGLEGLIARINQRAAPPGQGHQVVALFDSQGAMIAGNRAVDAHFASTSVQKIADDDHDLGETYAYFLMNRALGDDILVIGRDLRRVDGIKGALVQSMIAIGAVMTLVFITIGYQMSRTIQTKLEQIDDTLERVANGDSDIRLPVSSVNDQIDRMSRTMNTHLDRLSALMKSTKSSAASIAHDLKHPLARAYLGLERVLHDDQLADASRAHLEDTHAELAKLTATFEVILRIARIDAAQASDMRGTVDLAELTRDLGETYVVVAEESGHTLELEIDEGAQFPVRGDRGMIGQLIVNLLQNAITHCPPGTDITLGVQPAPGQVLVTVSDTGPGIHADHHDRLFDPFFRADAARTTEGSGLGMALVKSIADRHGATVALEDNAPGLQVTVAFRRA